MLSARVSTKRLYSLVTLAGGLGIAVFVLLPDSREERALSAREEGASVTRLAPWIVESAAEAKRITVARDAQESDPIFTADRLANAIGTDLSVEELSMLLRRKTLPPDERVFICQKLALCGSGAAMQVLFEAVAAETDTGLKKKMCGALDLLTNEEGIEAAASVAAATGDLVILNAVEDCLSRCSNADTVAYLAELHGEFKMDGTTAGRICSMLEGSHSSRAIPALGRLLNPDTPPDLFRSAALALSKSGGSESARALVNATRAPLPPSHRSALREVITSTLDAEHFEVFRDELTENPEDDWKSAYHEALGKDVH